MKWWERFVPVVMFGVTLVLITAVLMPHYDSGKGHAKTDAARMDLGQLKEGLERFRMDVGRYPTVAEGLGALLKDSDVAPWHGPYWKPDGKFGEGEVVLPHDPWGNEYRYLVPGDAGAAYTLSSNGPDGVEGTRDDLVCK